MTVEQIARACHEVNRALCLAFGDLSQVPWEEAPDWQRKSAISGVEFHRRNPASEPSYSHEEWMAEKLADGWKYGPVKDDAKKEHPCIVPFDELPPDQRAKDYVFAALVHALCANAAVDPNL